MNLWERLQAVNRFELSSECRNIPPSFERRQGGGQVVSQMEKGDTLVFFEKGRWTEVHSKQEFAFSNALRWKIDPETRVITLEHLRLGKERPIYLFSLTQIDQNLYKSIDPYECKEDTYRGCVLFDEHYVQLNWQITGPSKNQTLSVVYY